MQRDHERRASLVEAQVAELMHQKKVDLGKMAYFDQKYRIPTPPKNPKVLEYKQEARLERFKLLLNEL